MIQLKDQSQSESRVEQGVLFESLTRWAAIQPEARLLIEAETGRELSYAQALSAVSVFRRVFGERPCRIVLALSGGVANALCWLSALSGGHHLLPVSPDATDKEKLAVVSRHQPDVLIVERAEDACGFAATNVLVLTRQICEALIEKTRLLPVGEPREGCAYLMTSGSTGEPKGVILTERQIVWTARQICQSHKLSPQDRGLTVLPFFHVNAPVVSLCSSLLAGSTVVVARRFSRRQFWSWIERYQITWASVVPTVIALLLETEKPAFLPGSLRFIRTGSAALSPTHLRAFEERFAIPLIETYGLSEAASQVVANPLEPGRRRPGSAGLPTGVDLRICRMCMDGDESELYDLAQGELGEICIAGPGVITSYQYNEGQSSFQDGWFRTGDLGYLDAEGYLFIKGRQREVINRGGENIAPREIEEVLQGYRAVREAAVVGRPDPIYGEQPVAYLTTRENWSAEKTAELLRYAARHLSSAKLPVDLIILSELPRNAANKLDRRLLHAREQARCAVYA
jgi:acyl-CoA synthetase (AMP-forming)/AMP-acid ligase II